MTLSQVNFQSFPRTKPPPDFIHDIVSVFRSHEHDISTQVLMKRKTSNEVLEILRTDLQALGFDVETNEPAKSKLPRPVLYGENGEPTLIFEIDGYHRIWRCGLEVEAGGAVLSKGIYKDLFQVMLMVDVDHLCLAVPNSYKHTSNEKGRRPRNRQKDDRCYSKAVKVADALYSYGGRIVVPYGLTVVGY